MQQNAIGAKLAKIRVVLSHPKDARNIGAVCRAMKTMGLSKLYVVGGSAVITPESKRLAVHAVDVLENGIQMNTLEEAVRGCSFIAGFTKRHGQRRKQVYLTPRQLAGRLQALDAESALVFGNEASGLSDEELMICHGAVTIPSSPQCPSLNLSHAVQVITYEIRRTFCDESTDERYVAIDDQGLNDLVTGMIASINATGFHTQVGPQGMGVFLRDILARATISDNEAKRIGALFSKLSGIITHS